MNKNRIVKLSTMLAVMAQEAQTEQSQGRHTLEAERPRENKWERIFEEGHQCSSPV